MVRAGLLCVHVLSWTKCFLVSYRQNLWILALYSFLALKKNWRTYHPYKIHCSKVWTNCVSTKIITVSFRAITYTHLEQLHILKMYQNLLYWLMNSWGWSSSFSWQHIANINLNTRLRLLYYVCFKSWIYKIISTWHFRLFKYLFQNRDFTDWHSCSVHNTPKEIFISYIDGTLFKTSHKNL